MHRTAILTVVVLVVTTLCACIRQPYVPQEVPQDVPQATLDRIVVTIGHLQGPYTILGTVEWSGAGGTSPTDCDPNLRKEAIAKYGNVDAIIGCIQWSDGSHIRCSGTAVVFK